MLLEHLRERGTSFGGRVNLIHLGPGRDPRSPVHGQAVSWAIVASWRQLARDSPWRSVLGGREGDREGGPEAVFQCDVARVENPARVVDVGAQGQVAVLPGAVI